MREMKDSGIEWIGEIPTDWNITTISSAFNEIKQKNENNSETNAFSFRYGTIVKKTSIGSDEELTETFNNYTIVEPGTIMINGLNLEFDFVTQRIAIVMQKGIITSAYLAIFPKNFVDSQFACYLFKSYDTCKAFHSMGRGLRKTLAFNELKRYKLIYPQKPKQQQIAAYLDSKCAEIDTILEKTKATIEEYKKLKQSIITQAVTKGLDSNVTMKDSGVEWIGKIPAKWVIRRFKSIATLGSGGTPASSNRDYYNGDINWVCSLDLSEKEIYQTTQKLTSLGFSNCSGTMRKINSVLVAMYGGSGTIGNSGLLKIDATTNQAICALTFNEDVCLPQFMFYYIRAIRKYWMIYAVGTRKDPNISKDIVANMFVVLPQKREQQQIVSYLDSKCGELDTLIDKKQQLVTELESYKKSLIYECVTGKREVPDAI